MVRREIVVDTTKPETEWVRGRALRKVSPTYRHGVTQMRVAFVLDAWSRERQNGRVATEWRFRVTPPGEATRPLVPDVAFVAFDALPHAADFNDVDVPKLAPTLAVEILSPDDRADDVRDKIATYLRAGTIAVFIIDPLTETAVAHDRFGARAFATPGVLAHDAFEGLTFDLERLFAR